MGNCCSGGPSGAAIEYEADTTATNTPFPGTPDNDMMEKPANQLVLNPRLVPLLDFFSHLYARKKDLFSRVISVHGDELVEVLTKLGQVEESNEEGQRIIQRSRSLGDLKNQRMKTKTFYPDEGQPPAGTTKTAGTATKPA